jgi:MurNAc alpha-1-phosphate uridylyltransferase
MKLTPEPPHPKTGPPIKAMILAAGRGERMRPLTDTTPKPLLPVRGKPLMQWPLEALARGGFDAVVVNTAWLGAQIAARFNSVFVLQPPSNRREQLLNEERLQITYSHEGQDFGGALETSGGIARALPLLCPPHAIGARADVFWVLAGDVFAPDFVFTQAAVDRFVASGKLAHLWLVPNPDHNRKGDFGLSANPDDAQGMGLALNLGPDDARPRYTYSTIGLYRRTLFAPPYCAIPAGNPQGLKAPLAPLLRAAMDNGLVSAELYRGAWTDVGTPERLQLLNRPENEMTLINLAPFEPTGTQP